jgi:3-hydroxybutyryl-CoA dehydrogenase
VYAGRGLEMSAVLKNIGIIGAGQMGCGIAHVSAAAGYKVHIYDLSQDRIESGLATINGNFARQVTNGKMTDEERSTALSHITGSANVNDLAPSDLVIEAATEDESVKRKIYTQVCPVLKPEAILATNTSSLSITRLAAATDRPERFMGIHFMNPVPVMKLVEIIRGLATADEVYQVIEDMTKTLSKVPVEVNDFPGFVSNRILMPMINEAIYTLYEGVATKEAIDEVMKLGMNHPMGPLTLADFIGLDTCLYIMETLHQGFGDDKYRPCPLLRKYVKAGWLGKKSGRGFYTYE